MLRLDPVRRSLAIVEADLVHLPDEAINRLRNVRTHRPDVLPCIDELLCRTIGVNRAAVLVDGELCACIRECYVLPHIRLHHSSAGATYALMGAAYSHREIIASFPERQEPALVPGRFAGGNDDVVAAGVELGGTEPARDRYALRGGYLAVLDGV